MNSNQEPIDTIRLGPKAKKQLIEAINRACSAGSAPPPQKPGSADRRRIRVGFDALNIVVSIVNPDGGLVRYSVVSRNLSSHGMAFIHGQFIHKGRSCDLVLPNLRGEWVQIHGQVRDCRHIAKLIHEVAVVFANPIVLSEFVILSSEQAAALDQQIRFEGGPIPQNNSITLLGNVLVLDPLASDRKLLALWLGKHGLNVHQASSEKEALDAMSRQTMDLILLDKSGGQGSALDLVKRLRAAGSKVPVIVVSADDRDESRAAALAAGANAFLAKPVDQQSLDQIVEQLMLFDLEAKDRATNQKLRSQLAGDPELRSLVESFVQGLGQMASELKASLAANDLGKAKSLCFTIKGAGGSYGYPVLSRHARLALGQLQQPQPNLDDLGRSVDELLAIIARVIP